MSGFWTTLGATLLFACVAFAGMTLALAIPIFSGRKAKRRCACAASREVVRLAEERERAAFDAQRYRPEKVDLTDLPQISPDLAKLSRNLVEKTSKIAFKKRVGVVEKNVEKNSGTGFVQ